MTPSGGCWSRILQRGTVQSLFLFLSLLFAPARSGLVNVTVDDTFGDPTTGVIPQYSAGSDDAWNAGSPSENCPNCHINPTNLDLNQIHDKTWHDTTILPSGAASASITVQFTGSAVYVFNILPNTLQGTITSADISFSIDGADPAVFTRSPDSSPTILYHQLVYSNTALDYGPHTLVMTPNSNSLILFDYLVYTAQDDDHSAPPPSASPSSMSTSTSASSQPSPSPGTVTSTGTPDDNPQSSSSSTLLSTGSSQSSSRSLSLSHNTSSSSSSARFLNGSSQLSTGTSGSSSTPPASTTGPADGPSRSPSPSSHTPLGAIVGAALGGIAALLLAVALGVLCLRRRTWGKPKPSVTPFRPETAQVAVVVGSAANGGYGGYGRDTGTGTGGHGVDNLGDDVDGHGDGDRSSSFAPSMVSTAPLISSSSSSSSSEPRCQWLDEHHDRVVGRALLDAFDVRVPRPDSVIRTARRRASLRLGAATTTATVPGPLAPPSREPSSPSPSTDPEDSSEKEKEKRRAELARKLETLQSTRSALSSPDPTGTGLWVSRSASAANSNSNSNSNSTGAGGRGPGGDPAQTAIRDLEAEIAHLRAALTAMNARRLADSDPDPDGCHGDSGSELLPAYAE